MTAREADLNWLDRKQQGMRSDRHGGHEVGIASEAFSFPRPRHTIRSLTIKNLESLRLPAIPAAARAPDAEWPQVNQQFIKSQKPQARERPQARGPVLQDLFGQHD